MSSGCCSHGLYRPRPRACSVNFAAQARIVVTLVRPCQPMLVVDHLCHFPGTRPNPLPWRRRDAQRSPGTWLPRRFFGPQGRGPLAVYGLVAWPGLMWAATSPARGRGGTRDREQRYPKRSATASARRRQSLVIAQDRGRPRSSLVVLPCSAVKIRPRLVASHRGRRFCSGVLVPPHRAGSTAVALASHSAAVLPSPSRRTRSRSE